MIFSRAAATSSPRTAPIKFKYKSCWLGLEAVRIITGLKQFPLKYASSGYLQETHAAKPFQLAGSGGFPAASSQCPSDEVQIAAQRSQGQRQLRFLKLEGDWPVGHFARAIGLQVQAEWTCLGRCGSPRCRQARPRW